MNFSGINVYLYFFYSVRNAEEKCQVYQEYIDAVKDLSHDDLYAECDCNGIMRVSDIRKVLNIF